MHKTGDSARAGSTNFDENFDQRLHAQPISAQGQRWGAQFTSQAFEATSHFAHMGEAFATLITSDAFFPGVQVLVYSLRRVHASRPIVVLVSGQVSDAIADRVARIADSVIRVCQLVPAMRARGWVCLMILFVFGFRCRWETFPAPLLRVRCQQDGSTLATPSCTCGG